jgi:hypothetical protein
MSVQSAPALGSVDAGSSPASFNREAVYPSRPGPPTPSLHLRPTRCAPRVHSIPIQALSPGAQQPVTLDVAVDIALVVPATGAPVEVQEPLQVQVSAGAPAEIVPQGIGNDHGHAQLVAMGDTLKPVHAALVDAAGNFVGEVRRGQARRAPEGERERQSAPESERRSAASSV